MSYFIILGIGTEADEAQKLRNGDVTTQDDLLDESKYTTASAATTAEHDLLDVSDVYHFFNLVYIERILGGMY